jgi:hypothetical protein
LIEAAIVHGRLPPSLTCDASPLRFRGQVSSLGNSLM